MAGDDELAHGAINSATISPASAARSCSAKVLASTRAKRHAIAGFEQEDRIAMQLIGSDRGPPQQMPAARTGEALHAGLHAADRNRAGRRQQPRILPPRHVQELLEAAEIGPSRRKADHGDAVVAGDMPGHDIVGRGVERLGDIFQIDAVLAAIDDRNAPAPRLGRRRAAAACANAMSRSLKRVEVDLHGIIVHQQRSIGRHRSRSRRRPARAPASDRAPAPAGSRHRRCCG